MAITELSKFQAATLTHAANDGTRAFIVMESAPTDSEERRKSGRGCRVMSLTDVAIMMFGSTKAKEVVN